MPFIADEPIAVSGTQRLPTLYQLPKRGDWITLGDVTKIITHSARDTCPPDVVVILADGHALSIACETLEEACALRDSIAADRNAL